MIEEKWWYAMEHYGLSSVLTLDGASADGSAYRNQIEFGATELVAGPLQLDAYGSHLFGRYALVGYPGIVLVDLKWL